MPNYEELTKYATERELDGSYVIYRKWVIPASCTDILRLPDGMYLPAGVTKLHHFTEVPPAVCAKFFRHGRAMRKEMYERMDIVEQIDYHAFMAICAQSGNKE